MRHKFLVNIYLSSVISLRIPTSSHSDCKLTKASPYFRSSGDGHDWVSTLHTICVGVTLGALGPLNSFWRRISSGSFPPYLSSHTYQSYAIMTKCKNLKKVQYLARRARPAKIAAGPREVNYVKYLRSYSQVVSRCKVRTVQDRRQEGESLVA
jgi:hypothetical protein